MRERQKHLQSAAAGMGVAYFAGRWWAKRLGNEDAGGSKAAFEIGSVEIDGTKIGVVAGIAGAMGVTGDDTYDQILYSAGLSVLVAEQAVDAYKVRLSEPPES